MWLWFVCFRCWSSSSCHGLSLSVSANNSEEHEECFTQIGESTRKEVQCVNQKHKPVEACGEEVEEEEENE